MKFKQLSVRLPLSTYNEIQKKALVQNVSMNHVFNSILQQQIDNENVMQEVRRTAGALAQILAMAFPSDRREIIENIKNSIEAKNAA